MALQSLDFSCIRFNVLTVEADGGNPEKDAAVIKLLEENGYDYHGHVVTNDWFVRQGWVPSKA
jgi:hypothetical protein